MNGAAAALLAAGAAIAVVGVALRVTRRRPRRAALRRSALPLWDMMQRQGVTAADAEAAGLEEELRAARDQCEACRLAEHCREWLASGQPDQTAFFCPNARLWIHIRAHKRAREVAGGGSITSSAELDAERAGKPIADRG